MRYYGDLHNHTYFSDGKLSPYQILSTYSRLSYKIIAITDHDVLKGYFEASKLRNLVSNIILIPGCELTISFINGEKFSIHMLLYFKKEELSKDDFISHFNYLTNLGRGNSLLKRRLLKLKEYFPEEMKKIDENSFSKLKGVITRRHIFEILTKNGINPTIVKKMLANNSPAYVPAGIPLDEAIKFFKKYKMLKIMAHPAVGSSDNDIDEKDVYPPLEKVIPIIENFSELKILDGLEVFYPAHSKKQISELIELGNKLKVSVFTGGSDCHDLKNRPPARCGMDITHVKKFLNTYENL